MTLLRFCAADLTAVDRYGRKRVGLCWTNEQTNSKVETRNRQEGFQKREDRPKISRMIEHFILVFVRRKHITMKVI